ncbi:MAG: Lrp/AsnC family leucine-responsive transcriptional regulator, partial [Arenicella sp.]
MHLDKIDKQILKELQANARISNLELAERVSLSPTPCARRVRHLEESGVIVGHRTLLDPETLGLNLMAMISVTMDKHTSDRFEKFEQA